jgi:predicted ATPase
VRGSRLPEGVRAVVAERLARLSDDCRRVLQVAAVIGASWWRTRSPSL